MLTLVAPAKLNLTLEVLTKRQDGFHEIRSVIQTIRLYDTFRFQLGENIEFNCDDSCWIAEKSLVSRAVSLLREVSGCSKGALIKVNKSIPLGSGLGGDSSDVATVLMGLNILWKLNLSREELLSLAAQLGSDVSFFLHGGTALLEGRGEKVTPLPSLPHVWIILITPGIPILCRKTKQLYDRLQTGHYTDGWITQRLVSLLKEGGDFTPSLLFNTFESVAFTPCSELSIYREHIVKMGMTDIHLAGSGPSLFSLIKKREQAEALYVRLQKMKVASYLVDSVKFVDYFG